MRGILKLHTAEGPARSAPSFRGENVASQDHQALLIVNRRSRRGKSDPTEVADWLRSRGIAVILRILDSPEIVPRVIAAHPNCDIVIVAGGDGTLGSAAPALLRSGQTLGILPTGTANNLARTLGIPLEWMEAARIIADGRVHRVDLGCANKVPFFTLASVGMSGELTRRLSNSGKGRLGLLAYPRAALRALRRTRAFWAEIRQDGSTMHVRSIQLGVGNGRYFGARLKIAPDSAIDDRTLCLYSIEPTPLHRLAWLALKMPTGTHVRNREVLLLKGEAFELRTRPALPVDTDGELTTHTPARFRILPGAIGVYVPTSYASPGSGQTDDAP